MMDKEMKGGEARSGGSKAQFGDGGVDLLLEELNVVSKDMSPEWCVWTRGHPAPPIMVGDSGEL